MDRDMKRILVCEDEDVIRDFVVINLRRAGYERWLRNLAVGLGNAPSSIPVLEALKARRDYPSELVREHVEWALEQHAAR